ncbi:aminotransferase class III-fold pyridoxal phosphate-dependent enzyme [Klebsiella pneumoniae subsp. pneumoniae]|nr:aminotransferase class III-fold pyridoxal phosphate-dependent enzyme [Klebsiella pneumoniae subsp. pneumoniae]
MTVGTHGTTYGGNPLAGAVVAGELLSIVNTPEVLSGVRQRHQWFCERLQAMNAPLWPVQGDPRPGLLLGCVLNDAWAGRRKPSSNLAAEEGVMILIAGANVVRFAPALNVSEEEVNSGLDRRRAGLARVSGRESHHLMVIRPVEPGDLPRPCAEAGSGDRRRADLAAGG